RLTVKRKRSTDAQEGQVQVLGYRSPRRLVLIHQQKIQIGATDLGGAQAAEHVCESPPALHRMPDTCKTVQFAQFFRPTLQRTRRILRASHGLKVQPFRSDLGLQVGELKEGDAMASLEQGSAQGCHG